MGFLGFKQLVLQEDKLVSPLHTTVAWEPHVNLRAGHDNQWYNYHEFEVTVGDRMHCSECGFHSWKRPEFIQDYSVKSFKLPPRPVYWCVVDNNGFVVEHELGYRAMYSKLLFATKNKHELLEWCEDSLTDYMPQSLIDWCAGSDSNWKSSGDHFSVITNYLKCWLENEQVGRLVKPATFTEMKNFPRGWGRECRSD